MYTHTHILDTKANHRWLGIEIWKKIGKIMKLFEKYWNLRKSKIWETHISQIRMTKQETIGCIIYKVKMLTSSRRLGMYLLGNFSYLIILNTNNKHSLLWSNQIISYIRVTYTLTKSEERSDCITCISMLVYFLTFKLNT